ncbi:hypothetical protein [Asaia prunellae]|uniref:hypothetical protein n=1 Tax=Asaia prunellae TaxID=610245 RepID=UPI00190177CF|nr:hypothetical protein [Asaia prunellae]
MVQNDRALMQRFHAQTHLKRLTFRSTGATLQVKAFSPDVMTGVKPQACWWTSSMSLPCVTMRAASCARYAAA